VTNNNHLPPSNSRRIALRRRTWKNTYKSSRHKLRRANLHLGRASLLSTSKRKGTANLRANLPSSKHWLSRRLMSKLRSSRKERLNLIKDSSQSSNNQVVKCKRHGRVAPGRSSLVESKAAKHQHRWTSNKSWRFQNWLRNTRPSFWHITKFWRHLVAIRASVPNSKWQARANWTISKHTISNNNSNSRSHPVRKVVREGQRRTV